MQKQKPNIIFIMADDLGYWTPGCAGNKDAKTPYIDNMAKEGMMFENFFCASPVCSPARASLLTGRMPSTHGVLDWIEKGNINSDKDKAVEYLWEFKGYTDYLSQAGYICALSGKWHLGASDKVQKGFTHWYAHQSGGGSYVNAPVVKNNVLVKEKGYITDCITDDAIDFLNSSSCSNKPFYLGLHYTAPHTPWLDNHPKQYLDLYKNCEFESCPIEKKHRWQIDFEDFSYSRNEMLNGYFAATSAMDYNIGRIFENLKKNNLDKNTLVVFTSDNGFNCGHHGIWGKGNGTYPLNMYDTSVKVPFIAWMPSVIKGGEKATGMYSACDVFSTILEFANVSHNEENLSGTSFAKVLRGEGENSRCDIAVFDEYGASRMLRTKKYKYVQRAQGEQCELYDMQSDPCEIHNLVDKVSEELLNLLKRRLEEWFEANSRPETDGRYAGVNGSGQCKEHKARGFEENSFNFKYSAKEA